MHQTATAAFRLACRRAVLQLWQKNGETILQTFRYLRSVLVTDNGGGDPCEGLVCCLNEP